MIDTVRLIEASKITSSYCLSKPLYEQGKKIIIKTLNKKKVGEVFFKTLTRKISLKIILQTYFIHGIFNLA